MSSNVKEKIALFLLLLVHIPTISSPIVFFERNNMAISVLLKIKVHQPSLKSRQCSERVGTHV